eukprot:8313253-Pyramimonas_sp.AAC.1
MLASISCRLTLGPAMTATAFCRAGSGSSSSPSASSAPSRERFFRSGVGAGPDAGGQGPLGKG